MAGKANIVGWAAHDARTGEQIGRQRYTQEQAQRDADKESRAGREAIAKRVGELRG